MNSYEVITGATSNNGESLVRVLNPDGTVAQEATHLPSDSDLQRCYRLMRFVRILDAQMLNLQRQGRISFYGSCRGQEAAIIGSALSLEDGDLCVPALREGPAALLRGYPLQDYINQVWGNDADRCGGRQMPCHYSDKSIGHLSLSSPVANQVPQAVGMAYAEKQKGTDRVVMAYMGDGGTAEADFHIAMNFASLWKAPMVLICQNNQWAISTPVATQMATETIAEKAQAYGIPGIRVDGNDLLGMHDICTEAVARARAGEGPTFIEALTYRVGAHSTSDDPSRYRDENVTEVWATERDPIRRLATYLIGRGLMTAEQDEALSDRYLQDVKDVVSLAGDRPDPPIGSMFQDVFATVPEHLKRQANQNAIQIDENYAPSRMDATPPPWERPF